MQTQLKVPFNTVRNRAENIRTTMIELAPGWLAPGFVTPEELGGVIEDLDAHRGTLSRANTVLGHRSGVWRVAMEEWHAVSVLVTAIGRVSFKGSPHAHLWQRLRATGQGRECILQEGRAIEYAWESSDPAWWPKPGVTLTSYRALRAAAEEAAEEFAKAQNAASVARSLWHEKVNALHELCVNWYAVARATFPEDTTEGQLVRQVTVGSRRRRTPVEQRTSAEAAAA